MKLIVGLGNPGKKYEGTRHNLGFMVVDALASAANANWQAHSDSATCAKLQASDALLLKPLTFMNESGNAVREVAQFYKVAPADLWVVHDDLDLEFGRLKIDFAASAAGHRGVQSTIDALGTQEFWRLRLGLGRPPVPLLAETFVLQQFSNEEASQVRKLVAATVERIERALANGIANERSAIPI